MISRRNPSMRTRRPRIDGEAAKSWRHRFSLISATFGAPVTVSRRELQNQPISIIDAALRADTTKLPALVGVDLGTQGYAVVRVTKLVPRAPSAPEQAQQENAQVGQSVTAAEELAYYNLLKERFKAEILVPKPADTLPAAAR